MGSAVADIFREVGQLNQVRPHRRGNLVHLPDDAEVFVAGDIHGHRSNLAKIIDHARLTATGNRYLVLQEIIHGPPSGPGGRDRSAELLLRAARLKRAHPDHVLFLLANHDLAQITGNEIVKEGMGYCRAFLEGLEYCFRDEAAEVAEAVNEFLLSAPLAIVCANGVLISHSLPSPHRMDKVDLGILERPYEREDLRRGGGVYEWVWGRKHTAEQLVSLGERLDADFFVLSHQHVPTGWRKIDDRGLYLSSEHDHGYILRFSLDRPLSGENVEHHLKPIAGLDRQG